MPQRIVATDGDRSNQIAAEARAGASGRRHDSDRDGFDWLGDIRCPSRADCRGEKIVFSFHGEDVVVEILAGGRCRVSVGVTASPSVKILRHELWEKLDDGQHNHRVAVPTSAG